MNADLPHKPVLGLTGAPGSGKSTVARLFAELGCGVIDADQLAHDALRSPVVRDQLHAWWGDAVLDDSGEVDRAAVGRIVFGNRDELKRLESAIHPIVHAQRHVARQEYKAAPHIRAIIEVCPLLLEAGIDKDCDAVIFVEVPNETRYKRLLDSRGWDANQVQKREQFQMPLDKKRQSADYVIDNGVAIERVRDQIEQLLDKVLTNLG